VLTAELSEMTNQIRNSNDEMTFVLSFEFDSNFGFRISSLPHILTLAPAGPIINLDG